MPWWAYVSGYAVIAAGTARTFFLWNEDSKDEDIKFSSAAAGVCWPLVWAILAIGYTCVGIGKVLFAPSKKKRREAALARAKKEAAEREARTREAMAVINAEVARNAPPPAAIYPAVDWHSGTGAGE